MKRLDTGRLIHPTMVDVAALAGVSQMTVSRVVNGTGQVCERTRRKVDVAMAALRYTPNREARCLTGRTPIRVVFLYGSRFAGDLAQFLIGLSSQARLDNVHVLVEKCQTREQEAARLQHLIATGLDGVILTPLLDNDQALARVEAAGIPAVAVDCGPTGGRVGTVGIDAFEAARQMTCHLIALGHRRIGFVAGLPNEFIGARQVAGHLAAVEESLIERDDTLLVHGKFFYRCGLNAGEYLLGLASPPTAIVASNVVMAAAIIAVAQQSGLDVPSDLTVTGFGDSSLAAAIWPELTTIRQPCSQMARLAVKSLVSRTRALRQGASHEPEHVHVGFELVRRQSDAAPRLRPQACVSTELVNSASR